MAGWHGSSSTSCRKIIIEQVPGQSIKIQTHEQNIFSYKMEEIEKFEKEIVNTKKKFTNKDEIKQNPHSGFSFTLSGSIGSGTGSDNSGKGVIALHGLLGYIHKSVFTAGVSLGFSQWNQNLLNQNQLTTLDSYLSLRIFPLRRRVSPLIIADLGYGFTGDNYSIYTGGMNYVIGAGGRLNFTPKRALNLALCYKSQVFKINSASFYSSNSNTIFSSSLHVTGVCFDAGFSF